MNVNLCAKLSKTPLKYIESTNLHQFNVQDDKIHNQHEAKLNLVEK